MTDADDAAFDNPDEVTQYEDDNPEALAGGEVEVDGDGVPVEWAEAPDDGFLWGEGDSDAPEAAGTVATAPADAPAEVD